MTALWAESGVRGAGVQNLGNAWHHCAAGPGEGRVLI